MKILIAILILIPCCVYAQFSPGKNGTFDGNNNPITSTVSGSNRGLDLNIIGIATATAASSGSTVQTSSNATFYPLFVGSSTNSNQAFNLGTGLTFNPSTNVLTSTTFVGALTGTSSGNTTYTPNQYGVVLSGSGNTMTVLAPDSSTTKVLTSGGASANPSWQPVGGGVTSFNSRTGAVVPANNDYTWAQINKTVSSLADLSTRAVTNLSDGANVALLNAANIFTVGPQDVTVANGTQVGFIIQGATTQSGNLSQWKNSTGTVLSYVDSSGNYVSPLGYDDYAWWGPKASGCSFSSPQTTGCSSTPCDICGQSTGFLSSIAFVSTGIYTFNFSRSYASAPFCQWGASNWSGNPPAGCYIVSNSTSAIQIHCLRGSDGTDLNSSGWIRCVGK